MTEWAELDARSNFSFLEGGSHPAELVEAAHALGLAALGIADRNSVAGLVRAHEAARRLGLRFLPGARLAFPDGAELILYPRDRAAWGRLCRMLSLGRSGIDERGEADRAILKTDFRLSFDQAAALGEGLVALVPAPAWPGEGFARRLAAWAHAWPDALHLAARPRFDGRDRARLARLAALGEAAGAPMVATGGVLYHHPDRRALHDVLTCIRTRTTIEAAGRRLQANAERHLKPPAEMARLFAGHEAAIERALALADACRFSLDELRHSYPREPVPAGLTPDRHLRRLAIAGARARFPGRVPPSVTAALRKELRLIRQLGYAACFLTVHDIVAWARAQGILCQGRGSAANSVTCFCLGITAVNPTEQDLLFERFVSAERREPPDIDVDFEHERREEVVQHIYRRYGRHRAALAATVIHYRPRLAIREVGKALGLSEDVTARLAGTVWGSWGRGIDARHAAQSGVATEDPRVAEALRLAGELVGFPRHLSQHVGGFVLTDGPLIEMVPVHNAAMAGRSVIEWDKDDLDALGIMKVDVLALGMLTCIARAFAFIAAAYGPRLTLARVPRERPRVYDMLCRADSLGVFQVESRAQMNMLPRLRPRSFYDLVVEVAIVRPGPIQGDMVHPYLARRRLKREAEAAGRPFAIDFPAPAPGHGPPDELARVLGKTLGVPLFQEQAMRIAMEAAKFSGDEANGLRRAMATFRHVGTIGQYEELMVGRMIARGYPPDFARNCFAQIKGFGEYGFPESHAASFAHLVYVSSWLKCVFPEVFCAALLNSQPMGFYAPAQIVRDAREHGVEVRPVDVNASEWDCSLERRARGRRRAVRLGLRQIAGLREAWGRALVAARAAGGRFASPDELRERACLPREAIELLAAADAFGSLGLARRPAQWVARGGLPEPTPLPLFAAAGVAEGD
ncbi:MAG: error-prone DNA polymerase, partial [Sphingomonadaceae bacterium]